MTASHSFDGSIAVVRFEGRYPTREAKAAVSAAFADPHCPALTGILFDLRDSLSIVERSAEEVQDMMRFVVLCARVAGARIGLVAPSNDVAFDLLRTGAATAEQHGLKPGVFRTIDEARRWLRGDERPREGYRPSSGELAP